MTNDNTILRRHIASQARLKCNSGYRSDGLSVVLGVAPEGAGLILWYATGELHSGCSSDSARKGFVAGITASTAQTSTLSYKMTNVRINVILWSVRVMFIPPRLSWQLDTISLGDSTFMASLCRREQDSVLRSYAEGRGFDSRWCHWNFSLT
jgi:hypothetical protein